ncbi:MAG: hypothetical protein ACFHVJ_15170 [Aestuariibacter sp.]
MKKFVLVFLILISTKLSAAVHVSVVTSVGAFDSQWGVFNIETAIPTEHSLPDSCTSRRTKVSFDKSTPHGQDMLSIILTAFSTGKPLRIQFFNGACGVGGNLYPLANRVDVLRE